MNKLKKIQYDCHKATFLMEKRTMKPLTLFERVELHIHLAGCSVCRTYKQQSYLIGQMVHRLLYNKATEYHLDEKDKKVMEERIEEELKK
ncbi:MAG: hypothetical protein V4592_24730 [Bacteroidota bacterium]